ncbi:RNA polymerase sigma factor [Dyadobacter sandarakinus]|uniref:RNA polymerase sigma factor n=1 Tax=Dyadobacter sandarakinus TaxID=2747268 RepID=A0ABX7IAH7_9BACT|nr:RNA polymerase sigma factor [Dyadobacter sandarakinus]QRR03122.1 RNA polymerase sigma factor [Dyadobacter sandarakinus]
MIEPSTHTTRRTLSDEELIRLFLTSRDNAHFERLYKRYVVKVHQKCLTLIKDPVLAQDLTQEVFYKLHQKLDTFRQSARFSTWLYSITYNMCMDQVRISGRNIINLHGDMTEFEDASEDLMLDEGELSIDMLRSALTKLKLDERAMLYMKYLDNKSIRDIAQIFEINESAVKMRLMRCREKLRKKYFQSLHFN